MFLVFESAGGRWDLVGAPCAPALAQLVPKCPALPADSSTEGLEAGTGLPIPAAHYPPAYVSLRQVAFLVQVFKSKLLT